MKKVFVNAMEFGQAIDEDLFCIEKASAKGKKMNDGRIPVILSDKTGKVCGRCPASFSFQNGDCVELSAIVLSDEITNEKCVVIKEIKSAGEYEPADMYEGLPPEKIPVYITSIREMIPKIDHPGYRALVEACLTDEALQRLSEVPCTLNWYGRYRGAALAATDQVTRMVVQSMAGYVKHGNGLTTAAPSWSLLLAASLLHAYGRTIYFEKDDPFKRSKLSISLGYFPMLQRAIQDVIRKNSDTVHLTDQEEANLLNVLAVSVSMKSEIRSISKDGAILRGVIRMYADCDSYDWEVANHTPEEGENFYYSKNVRGYVMEVE